MTFRIPRLARKVLVGTLIAGLVVLGSPAFAAGAVQGVVVRGESAQPASGVRVHLADPATGEIRTSAPTAADGSFTVVDLPEARYEVGVEADGGLYLVPTPVEIGPESTVPLHLTLAPAASGDEKPIDIVGTHRKGVSVWNNPLTATLVVLGIAVGAGIVVDQVFEDDDSSSGSASPFILE